MNKLAGGCVNYFFGEVSMGTKKLINPSTILIKWKKSKITPRVAVQKSHSLVYPA